MEGDGRGDGGEVRPGSGGNRLFHRVETRHAAFREGGPILRALGEGIDHRRDAHRPGVQEGKRRTRIGAAVAAQADEQEGALAGGRFKGEDGGHGREKVRYDATETSRRRR
jgi:hypothetical protein